MADWRKLYHYALYLIQLIQHGACENVCVGWGYLPACTLHHRASTLECGHHVAEKPKLEIQDGQNHAESNQGPELTSSWTTKRVSKMPSDFWRWPFSWGLKQASPCCARLETDNPLIWKQNPLYAALDSGKLITHSTWKQNQLSTLLDSGGFVLQTGIETCKSKFTLKTANCLRTCRNTGWGKRTCWISLKPEFGSSVSI